VIEEILDMITRLPQVDDRWFEWKTMLPTSKQDFLWEDKTLVNREGIKLEVFSLSTGRCPHTSCRSTSLVKVDTTPFSGIISNFLLIFIIKI
jgi:hypothetical protein